jgi:hypothetical protein
MTPINITAVHTTEKKHITLPSNQNILNELGLGENLSHTLYLDFVCVCVWVVEKPEQFINFNLHI